MNQAPKYGKIELDVKVDDMAASTDITTKTFEDCGMFITGDRIVIVIDEKDSIQSTEVSRGIIFDLSEVAEYRTYKE